MIMLNIDKRGGEINESTAHGSLCFALGWRFKLGFGRAFEFEFGGESFGYGYRKISLYSSWCCNSLHNCDSQERLQSVRWNLKTLGLW